ncbi:MAG: hypothetical protein ABEK12_00135, partial [Candidatus Nanohaloarchaea archaeon]
FEKDPENPESSLDRADDSSPSSGEKVAVHGMSGVPERYAPAVLEKFAPEPVPDAYNVFVFHQSVENLVYTDPDHDVLTMADLPDGFDLQVDGHIHWRNLDHLDSDKHLVLPGSTIATQMRKTEAEVPKGYLTVDTETGEVEFHELETPRAMYYEEIDASGMSTAAVLQAVDDRMADITAETDRDPLVRLVLSGETDARVTRSEIRDRYPDAVLSVSTRFDRGESPAADVGRESSESIAEMGRQMLREKMSDDIHLDDLFDLLADGAVDEAVDLVEEMDVPGPDEATGTDDPAADEDADDRTLTEFS